MTAANDIDFKNNIFENPELTILENETIGASNGMTAMFSDFEPTSKITELLFRIIYVILLVGGAFVFAWVCQALLSRSPRNNFLKVISVWVLIFALLPSLSIIRGYIYGVERIWLFEKNDVTFNEIWPRIAIYYAIFAFFAVVAVILFFTHRSIYHYYKYKKNNKKGFSGKKAHSATVLLAVFFSTNGNSYH
mmetsp:Transcript_59939/g.89002  ORF Transcript_59939/g.89002 Transcript_59939/m.89002 type:complete len:192 (+) Transcript_59939:3-578(+)